ncbi:MAG: sigma-70 family RNA polymerase sigma factor, partial [Candidatus Polarisedimenticolia bacterium]
SREVAEDILQDAFVRGIDGVSGLRERDSVVAWFYRMLRNAIADHYRRRGAEERALGRVAAGEAVEAVAPSPDADLMDTVCTCVTSLLDTLKPEYAAVLRRVDLEGAAVREFATETGITANNAGVRLHRAREALRRSLVRACGTCATHGCVDCGCAADRPGCCRGGTPSPRRSRPRHESPLRILNL